MSKYEDMYQLPHYEPKNHSRMSIENRAAQFAPFAALTGFKESIMETSREVTKKHELTEEEKDELNKKLLLLSNNMKVSIIYFVPDKRKSGGAYHQVIGIIKKIDLYHKVIVLDNQLKIAFDNLYDLTL